MTLAAATSTRTRTRWRASVTVGLFVAMIAIPGSYHALRGTSRHDWQRWREIAADKPLADAPRLIEEDLNQRFLAAQAARTLMYGVPIEALRPRGLDRVAGMDGFVFEGVDYDVTRSAGFLHGRLDHGADAVEALADMAAQLQTRGIKLLVIPVPAKASIYPEYLPGASGTMSSPALNVDHAEWFARLREKGVEALDLTDPLWQAKSEGTVYFAQESHWSQWVQRRVAPEIVARLRRQVPDLPPARTFRSRWIPHVRPGDLADRIDDPRTTPPIPVKEQVLQLLGDDGSPYQAGDDAPVLLLGDSFAGLLNSEGISLAQVLTNELGVPVQSAALVGGNGDSIRELSPLHLKNKRAVVLVFTIRLVICSKWDKLPVPGF